MCARRKAPTPHVPFSPNAFPPELRFSQPGVLAGDSADRKPWSEREACRPPSSDKLPNHIEVALRKPSGPNIPHRFMAVPPVTQLMLPACGEPATSHKWRFLFSFFFSLLFLNFLFFFFSVSRPRPNPILAWAKRMPPPEPSACSRAHFPMFVPACKVSFQWWVSGEKKTLHFHTEPCRPETSSCELPRPRAEQARSKRCFCPRVPCGPAQVAVFFSENLFPPSPHVS